MRFLVTGAQGCIGAWAVHELLADGHDVVASDIGDDVHRLDHLLGADRLRDLERVELDITDLAAVASLVGRRAITHIVHLAALQVPYCRADPSLGAAVNVVGTVNVFEAARRAGLETSIAYASSVAAFSADDDPAPGAPPPSTPTGSPGTHYGVYKRANEDGARVFFAESGVASVGLRPYVVYGVGRDRGMTSKPTFAMLAATLGRPFHIPFGGSAQYQHARDAARAFIMAAGAPPTGARVFNLAGDPVHMAEIVDAITLCEPNAQVTYDDVQMPFPPAVDDTGFDREIGPSPRTPLRDGVAETIDRFRALVAAGRLSERDLDAG